MRLDTSSVQVPRCFKQLSHWTRLELDGRFKISNKIRLLAWSFRYHNRFKLPLLVDLVKIVFSSLGNVVAFGAEGTLFDPNLGCCNITTYL